MEDFSIETLRLSVQSMQDVFRCVICLETVRPNMIQCVNGHLMCSECKSILKYCPTCREPFSVQKPPRVVSQIVEALPQRCKHKNCPKYIETGDDHEKYCGLKVTKCQKCEWSGPGKDLIEHVRNKHSKLPLYSELYTPCSITDFNPKKFFTCTSAITLYGHFFWFDGINDPNSGFLTRSLNFVPNGKPKENIYVKIVFTSQGPEFICKIKLNLDPGCEYRKDNVIAIPCSALSNFIDEEGKLNYKMYVSTN